ncbi:NAD(P)-binding domain-containing protein [Nocardioides convexus]|uniref:flavin-containing monooxygenase n=1 Tax=Nocardioides convexus TaxID=2712224 RepID=UPI002418AB7D|nr:NAD(P)-binding domain-containing protein [Nocardioides convexus]
MTTEQTEVLVVGAGQAGVAMSEHLSDNGIPHLVLERDRIAERWRTMRWDSLVANGPAWHDRFPGLELPDVGADEFAGKDQVAAYFEAYAEKIAAPIRTGVEVRSVTRNEGRPGFHVETSEGTIDARYVVAATGPFQRPVVPPIVPTGAVPLQIHSSDYRNPDQAARGQRPRRRRRLLRRTDRRRACSARAVRSTSRSDRTTVRPAATAAVTSVGGSASSTSGTSRPRRPAPSTSPSRSAVPVAATRSTSAPSPRSASRLVGLTDELTTTASSASARTSPRTSPVGTPTTWPCSGPPTSTSRATASTSPRSRRPKSSAPTPTPRSTRCCRSTSPRPASPRSCGPPASRSTTAGSRSTPSTTPAARSTAGASPPSPASTSWACRGSPAAGRDFIWGVWHDAKHVAGHIATQRGYLSYGT